MYTCTWCSTINQDSDQVCWQCGRLACSQCRLAHGTEWLIGTRGVSRMLLFQAVQFRGCLGDLSMDLPPIRGDFATPDWVDQDYFERSLTRTAFEHGDECSNHGCTEYDGHEDKAEGEYQVPTWLADMALKLVLAGFHSMGDPDFDNDDEDGDEGAQDAVDVWYYYTEIESVEWGR